MKNQEELLLIVGYPRSGTKLLRQILSNHSQIFITHELLFLPNLLINWGRYGDLSLFANFLQMYKDVMGTYYFMFKLKRGATMVSAEEWYSRCTSYDPVGIFCAMIKFETGAPDVAGLWLGDKSPNYTTHLAEIKKAIPEARIIHIVRDVRDAALSARKVWKKNIYRFAQRWGDGMRKLRDELITFPASHVCELRYEDLVKDPESTVRRALEFLELDYDPDILELHKPSENLGDTRSETRIVRDNMAKYKTQLSANQIRRMESVSWDMLEWYGYDVGYSGETRRFPGWLMAWYMFCDIFNRVLFDMKLKHGPLFVMKSVITRYRTRM